MMTRIPCLEWDASRLALASSDPFLAKVIKGLGPHRLESRGEPFTCLVRSIVGQQISVKAAESVWRRLTDALEMDPAHVLQPAQLLGHAGDLQSVGLSGRKVSYLLALATRFDQEPDLTEQLYSLPDHDVIELLTDIPGIGPWTAQMFLIFTLMRPDVFPADDLGILNALGRYYADQLSSDWPELSLANRKKEALAYSERWAPHRTVATWLLWRSLDPVPVAY